MSRKGLDQHTVLLAAMEMADEHGLEAVTLAALAKKLGIRTPSLYNHIDGMQGLRSRLSLFGLQKMYEVLTRAAVGKSKDDAIRGMATAYVSFAREHPGLYEATQRSVYWQEEEVHHASQQIVDLFVQVLQAYDLERELAIHLIRGLRSLLHGFASLEQQGGFGMQLDVNESLRLLVDTFLEGIHAYSKKMINKM